MGTWQLVGLSGYFDGASLDLENGIVSLGSSPDCDICLEINDLPETLVHLQVNDEGLSFRLANQQGDDDNVWTPWEKYTPVDIFGVIFSYGESGHQWQVTNQAPKTFDAIINPPGSEPAQEEDPTPVRVSPQSTGQDASPEQGTSPEKAMEDAADSHNEGQSDTAENDRAAQASNHDGNTPNAAVAIKADADTPDTKQGRPTTERGNSENPSNDSKQGQKNLKDNGGKKNRFGLKTFGIKTKVASCAVVLCTIITAQLFPTSTSVGDTETNMMEQVEAEPTISIEEFLATAGYTDLLVDRKTQPALPIITGIVNTKKDVLAIEQWLTANAMTARVSVELTSNYKVAAESILALLELDEIQISLSETPGELIATGRTGYPDKWAEAKRKIESEVAGLKVLTDSVVGIDEELMFLTEEIELAGITDEIILQHESTHINVQLWLHPQNVATWHRIQARFEKIFSADKLQVVPIIITGIDVRGVSLGKSPFIRTADGSQYSVGDRLPNGFTLYQISQDHLIFTSGGKYAKYPIGKA